MNMQRPSRAFPRSHVIGLCLWLSACAPPTEPVTDEAAPASDEDVSDTEPDSAPSYPDSANDQNPTTDNTSADDRDSLDDTTSGDGGSPDAANTDNDASDDPADAGITEPPALPDDGDDLPVQPPPQGPSDGAGEVWPEAGATMSSWVYADGSGGLGYRYTDSGDRIPDFSYAGYGGGGVAFPTAPVVQTLDPTPSGDDTARIQAALDAAAALPLDDNGMRGTVLLRKGTYRIAGQLLMEASGVILRGEGRSETGTVLRAKGTDRRSLIVLGGQGSPKEVVGTRRDITDAYVPVGTHTITVDDTTGYEVGQRVIIERDSTAEWLDYIGMDSCDTVGTSYDISDVNERTCLEVPWEIGGRNLEFDRVITAVNGNQITVDAPLTMSFESRFGGGWIYQFTYPGRIQRSGVENLRGESAFSGPEDEDHSWNFIEMSRIEDAWVDRIVARYFAYAAVMVGRWSRRVTVEDSRCLDPISQITGARRYSFKVERATQVLVQRCDTREGRHDFVLGQLTVGPNVFLQGTSVDTHDDIGPHAGWSPGALFDGIVTDHDLNIRHRGNMGTNHGWVSANSVVWNSNAVDMKIESPPGAQNWCIGCVASTRTGNGVWESPQNHVWPESLYLAQLRRRLGDDAVAAIGGAN